MIHKKGDTSNWDNYRPIALLDCFYKAYSLIILGKLETYFLKNNIISDLQFGFKPGFSVSQAIWTCLSIIEDANRYDKEIHIEYLDFKKAYDRVEWDTMIRVLEYYKTPAHIVGNIQAILSNRSARFITPIGTSAPKAISRGLPQGDTISPILFSIFFNILLTRLKESGLGYKMENSSDNLPNVAFADDLSLFAKSEVERNKLMDIVHEFCVETGFDLNVSKTISSSNDRLTNRLKWKTIDEDKVEEIGHCYKNVANRFLGLWISIDLKWDQQIKLLISNLSLNLLKIKKIRTLSLKQRIMLINLIVIPHIRFRLQYVVLPDRVLKDMEDYIKISLNSAVGVQLDYKIDRYFLPVSAGGYGLLSITSPKSRLHHVPFKPRN